MQDESPKTPRIAPCVSFCEAADPCAGASGLADLMALTCAESGFPQVERVYAGSYFCENYFLGLPDSFHDALADLAARYDLGATLVVPIFGQAFCERGRRRVAGLLERYANLYDEVVVNDVAAYFDLAGDLAGETGIRLGLGRLFSKGLRDVRYPEMFDAPFRPSLSAEAAACLRLGGASPLVEVDPASAVVDASALAGEVFECCGGRLELALHLPWCYATTGRTCSAASAQTPDGEKFRLGRGCARQCLRLVQGSRVDGDVRYVKHGRTYFYANPACRISGVQSWRVVYAAATPPFSLGPR